MRVWIFDQFYYPDESEQRQLFPYPGRYYDPAVAIRQYDDHLRYLRRADELGFDGICVTEHHYTLHGLPSPNLMAAALARETTNAKIVLLGNAVPLHAHPVRLAEELAMIDVLSKGRLISGMMRGGFLEYYAYSVEPSVAREKFEEAWNLIIECWTANEPFAWHGKHFNYENISITPRPVQKPFPQLVMAANTAESIEWCAERRVPLACSFSPTDALKENFAYYRKHAETKCGWMPGPEHALFSRQMYVAPTKQQAREEAEHHLMELWRELPIARELPQQIERFRTGMTTERSFVYKQGKSMGAQFIGKTFAAEGQDRGPGLDYLIEKGLAIVGDPDSVTEQIRYQQKEFGAGTFLIYSPFATLPLELATRSMELFAKEVMPNLQD